MQIVRWNMKRGSVRIERIEIQNFKNVKKGQITLRITGKSINQVFLGYMVRMALERLR